MKTNTKIVCLGSFITGICFAPLLSAQELPKAGTFTVHTGWKLVAEPIEVADKITQGHGNVVGVSFNDKGSGPLHQGPAICFFTFFTREGKSLEKGYCAFGDPDGDRIFTDWDGTHDGTNDQGINRIAGGTGKYKGITGSGPWKCWAAGAPGASRCIQQFDYKLP